MEKSKLKSEEALLHQRGARLRLLRNMTGMTQAAFGKLCQVSEPSIRLWEKSQTTILSEKGALKIINGLKSLGIDCSLDWILSGIGDLPINQLFLTLTTQSEVNEEKVSFGTLQPEINLFSKNHTGSIVTIVEDNTMEPFLQKNDIVGGTKLYGESMDHGLNRICIIEDAYKNIFIRRIIKNLSNQVFRLGITNLNVNTNEAPIIDTKLLSVAIISRIWRNTN